MTYQILDEPEHSTLNHLVCQPVWPFFALMFGGGWLAFPWFCFNAFAMGCPSRKKTMGLTVLAMAGSFLLVWIFMSAAVRFEWDRYQFQYGLLAVTCWKLGLGYWLYILQSKTFEIYEHFGGLVRNGIIVVFAGYFLRSKLLGDLPILVILAVA